MWINERKGKWRIYDGSGRIVVISRDKRAAIKYAKEQLNGNSYGKNTGVETTATDNDGSDDVDVH